MKTTKSWRIGSICLVFFLLACGGEELPAQANLGQVRLSIATAPEVAYVRIEVTAADMDPVEQDCVAVDAAVACSLYIQAGLARTFAATAYDQANQAIYAASAVLDVPRNSVTSLTLTLQSLINGAPGGQVDLDINFNHAPVIRWVSLNPNPAHINRAVNVQAEVEDPDNDPLSYQWSASAGTITNSTNAFAIWHTPNVSGMYDVTISVWDGQGGQVATTMRAIVRS